MPQILQQEASVSIVVAIIIIIIIITVISIIIIIIDLLDFSNAVSTYFLCVILCIDSLKYFKIKCIKSCAMYFFAFYKLTILSHFRWALF